VRDIREVLEMPSMHCPAMQTTDNEGDCAAVPPVSNIDMRARMRSSPANLATEPMDRRENRVEIMISFNVGP
jgi:hypothetical protein